MESQHSDKQNKNLNRRITTGYLLIVAILFLLNQCFPNWSKDWTHDHQRSVTHVLTNSYIHYATTKKHMWYILGSFIFNIRWLLTFGYPGIFILLFDKKIIVYFIKYGNIFSVIHLFSITLIPSSFSFKFYILFLNKRKKWRRILQFNI